MPELLKPYLSNGRALDFGCGPGLSTRFLTSLGYETIGVDINQNMVKEALSEPDGVPFAWIGKERIPFGDDAFEIVSSIMVLLEMPSLQTMRSTLTEIHRVLKPGGIFLAVVGSEHFHKHEWLNKSPVHPEKYEVRDLKTGDEFQTYSKITGITFKDYFYTTKDYVAAFNESGFEVVKIHEALGRNEDDMPWKLEMELNPFTHFICQKAN